MSSKRNNNSSKSGQKSVDKSIEKNECNDHSSNGKNSESNTHLENTTQQREHSNELKVGQKASSSRLPIYTANGNINRQRHHSDGQSGQQLNNSCRIHGIRGQNPIYGILCDQNTSTYALPDEIKALHSSHRCSNRGKSRSVPTSNLVSTQTSPASTPLTPTDSRRKLSNNRNALTPTSTPSRSGSKSSLSTASHTTRSSVQKNLSEYMPLCEVQKGLKKGDIVEGVLRINPRNYMDAYISAPEGGVDIYVGGMIDRNRAFNGDKVAVKLHEPNNWKEIKQNDKTVVQKTGKIVYILEKNHPRLAGGHLQQMKDKNPNWALFVPNDSRVPRMKIPMKDCPQGFLQHPQHFTHSLFIAKLDEWKISNFHPTGILVKHLGDTGDIEAESELILTENNIEFIDFPEEAFIGLPDISDNKEWTIPETEIRSRRDLRKECVFTIDPSTARDLDDALSIKRLDNELFEIGVHIADVSYFVKEDIPLDEIARRRTTSVYLVQKVIPMLPRVLCEKLCSLNPGEDKLTFSVVWIINKDGQILEEWFGRTIINSCIKLSYELAQDMIDEPNREWKQNELPNIYGNWSHKEISESVNLLNEIAVKLRKARFDSGALKIEKLKLHFVLDNETGLPSGFSPYIYRDSNRLIEEFMLLANMAVAQKTYKTFDEKAFLRSHPPPGENPLNEFKSFCKYNNFEVDTSSSQALQKSLNQIIDNNPNISKVVAHFLLKAMQMATYLCVGVQSPTASFHHYALNVPLYTHFTSPIRRYADVIVHRLLAASLSYRSLIKDSVKDLHRLAQKCNEMKLNARIVSENSARLFLNIYIKQIGKMEEKAIVVQVYDHSFDVMLLNCGVICRVYLDQLPLKEFIFESKQGKNEIILKWNNDSNDKLDSDRLTQIITACLMVKVQVSVNKDDSTKWNAILEDPNGVFRHKKNFASK